MVGCSGGRIVALLVLLAGSACNVEKTEGPPDALPAPESSGEEAESYYNQVKWTFYEPITYALSRQLFRRHENIHEVMRFLDVDPGMTVADIGCGLGHFTPSLSRHVGPRGRVFAFDIQQQAVTHLDGRLEDREEFRFQNVRTWVNPVDDARLPPASVDVGLISHMDWYVADELLPENVRFLESVYRGIAPGGRLVVLQHDKNDFTMENIPRHFQAVGFELLRSEHYKRHDSWIYDFRRPEADPEAAAASGTDGDDGPGDAAP